MNIRVGDVLARGAPRVQFELNLNANHDHDQLNLTATMAEPSAILADALNGVTQATFKAVCTPSISLSNNNDRLNHGD